MERDAAQVVEGTAPMVPRGGIASLTVILCLVLFLPGFFSLPVTEHESHIAQASREMYESAALPTNPLGRANSTGRLIPPDPSQPPLTHWVQAGAAWMFSSGNPHRDSIWMYRLPSLIAAIFAVVFTRRLASSIFDRSVGRLAALLLMICPLVAWGARQATPDTLSLALVTGALLGFWHALNGNRLSMVQGALLWLAVAAATLSGGLVTLLSIALPCLTVGLFARRWRWLLDTRPLYALAAILIVSAWALAAGSRLGPVALLSAWTHGAIWPEGGTWLPPGFHAVLVPIIAWPGSLLLAAGLFVAWKLGRGKTQAQAGATIAERARLEKPHPGYQFLIAWLIPVWLLIEVQPGKSPMSALVLYPPLAIIAARALLAAAAGALPGLTLGVQRACTHVWLVVGAGAVFVTIASLAFSLILFPSSTLGTLGAGLLSAVGFILMMRGLNAGWKDIQKGRWVRAGLGGSGVLMVITLLVFTIALPRYLGLGSRAAREVERIDPSAARPLAAIGLHLDSLLFHSRGRVSFIEPSGAASWLAEHPAGLVIRDADAPSPFPAPLKRVSMVDGIDTSRWRPVTLAIEERAP